jgi:hypothetical protein
VADNINRDHIKQLPLYFSNYISGPRFISNTPYSKLLG